MSEDVTSSGTVTRRERTVSKSGAWLSVIGAAGNIGWMIAIPAVLFVIGGAYLDKWLGTSPFFVLLGIPLAMAISALSVWRLIKNLNR